LGAVERRKAESQGLKERPVAVLEEHKRQKGR